MRKLILWVLLLFAFSANAQYTLSLVIKDDRTKLPVVGATAYITDLKTDAVSDTSGILTINNIPISKIEVKVTMIGYLPQEKTINLPLKNEQNVELYLEPIDGELAEVVIQVNRSGRNRSDIPTRIEALPAEELDEKGTMRPGDIKRLLGEITGVRVQSTSAVSGLANFRIQGLDSRYTQLLLDGLPLYGGFSSGLSLVQVSPLNLKQVEIIKGSSSTLYGGGAIAGLVNLISKTPSIKPELNFMLSLNNAKGTDLSGYYSKQWQKVGTTIFASYNHNGAFDPGNTGFTAIPKTSRFQIAPKFFWTPNQKNSLWLGVDIQQENRLGGDMQVLNGNGDNEHQYFERNKSDRLSPKISYTYKLDSASQLNFRSSLSYFKRSIELPAFNFEGSQSSSYTEFNYVHNGRHADWVAGANIWTDHLTSKNDSPDIGYSRNTYGAFAQNTFKPTKWFALESGLRLDRNSPAPASPIKGWFLLPRLNMLFTINEHWSSRIGGGLGYKMPDVFNDDVEERGYRYLQPFNIAALKAEYSSGTNVDVNYKGIIGDAFIQINQLVFLTKVNDPLILQNNAFINAPGYLISRGAETNIKVLMEGLGIYLGYTYNDVQRHFNKISNWQTLSPKHQLNVDFTYEVENNYRLGVEAFYTDSQLLGDGTIGRSYWNFGLLAQKMWKHFDLFLNAENITNQRQSKWEQLYTGSISSPKFKDIYAPLEGIVVNVGIKLKLY